jgi:RimJ/RimL family protein N-acetyltransferase
VFAVTERLLLRPGWADDAPALTAAVANKKIARNLSQLPWPYAHSDALWFLTNVHGQGIPEFLIFTRHGEPQLVGAVGLHSDPENADGAPELGYWIAEAFWGQGYATEAARAVVQIARWTLKLKSLTSGFRSTGKVVSRHSAGRGKDVPCVLLSLDLVKSDEPDNRFMPSGQMQMQMAA